MRTRSVALLVLSLSSAAAGPAEAYLLWDMTGAWTYLGKPVERLQAVTETDVANLLPAPKGSGTALLIRSGIFTEKKCDSPQSCTTIIKENEKKPVETAGGRSGTANKDGFWASVTTSLTAKPAFQLPMSRAAGWRDAVVVKQADGTIDLKDVFSAARARIMNFELCPIETDHCVKGLSADWDGTAARLKEQRGLALGTYRLIALSGSNEAWVRVVDPGEYAQVKKAYEEAVATIRTWSLPPEWDGAPSLDRLERMALAGLGHGR